VRSNKGLGGGGVERGLERVEGVGGGGWWRLWQGRVEGVEG